MACEMVSETSDIVILAKKLDNKTIKIWNYINGLEVITL